MINSTVKPRLKTKVRQRFDRRTGRYLLLYPETGLELNNSAMEIARLCTGDYTVDDITGLIAMAYRDVSPIDIAREVQAFLHALAGRGLLQGLP